LGPCCAGWCNTAGWILDAPGCCALVLPGAVCLLALLLWPTPAWCRSCRWLL
jgi:hypothetical protein